MEVYIHLGIHKTGSSFLQKIFFPNYTGKVCYLSRPDLKNFKDYILNEDDFKFNNSTALNLFNNALGTKGKFEKIIISDEEFYGNPYLAVIDRKRNFDRLFKTFGNSLKVIIFLRNQQNLLNSLYNQYVKTGGTANFKSFLNYKKYPLNFRLSYLFYDRYVDYVKKSLGNKNVRIFLYEEFLESKTKILNEMNKFVMEDNYDLENFNSYDKRVNLSLSNGNVPLLRFINKFTKSLKSPFLFFPNSLHKLFRIILLKISFGFVSKKKFNLTDFKSIDSIKASNTRLKNCCKELQLKKYHYLVSDDVK